MATFTPLDPAAPAYRVHYSGDWTFNFEHNQNLPPSDDSVTMYPILYVFFSGPHGNDGITNVDLGSRGETLSVSDFTGKISFTIHVDGVLTWGPEYYANITGPGYDTAYAFVEDIAGGTAPPSESLIFTSIDVRGLTMTLTAIPEPGNLSLLLAGFISLA